MFTPRYSRPGAGMALLLALVATALGAPAAGADVIASSSSGYEGGPALSSDGRVIVGERRGSGARRILAIDPATRAVSEVASFGPLAERERTPSSPRWGPGGSSRRGCRRIAP